MKKLVISSFRGPVKLLKIGSDGNGHADDDDIQVDLIGKKHDREFSVREALIINSFAEPTDFPEGFNAILEFKVRL